MHCNNNCCNSIGYTSLTNGLTQTIVPNSPVNLGYVLTTSKSHNVTTQDGNLLVVNHSGTYYLDFQVVGTPTADTTVSLAIKINGFNRAIVTITTPATPIEDQYFVRGIFYMEKGDVITLENIGTATLTLDSATLLSEYNVSTIIQKFN